MNVIRMINRWVAKRRHRSRAKSVQIYGSLEELFTAFYRRRVWTGGGDETVSGSGSTLAYTTNLRRKLPELLKRHGIESVFDAPCGDYHWFQHVQREGVRYVGGDIVRELVDANNRTYQNASTSFIPFDITSDAPPPSDLWICRDCLFHFSYEHMVAFFENFVASGTPLLLTTTHHRCRQNMDIPTGSGRQLNLEIAPLNLAKAVEYIDDGVWRRRPRRMGLWRHEQVAAALPGMRGRCQAAA